MPWILALRAFFGRISPAAWRIIIVVAVLAAGVILHQRAAHKALRTADATGYARAMTEVETKAKALKAKADRLNAAIAADERKRNDEQARHIARDADDLRLRGAGKAICPRHAGLPGGSSGPVAPGRPADDTLDPVLDGRGAELIALPFDDTVAFAEQRDLDRAEVLSWRSWYDRLVKAWPALVTRDAHSS
jgi:hypothetical protein